MSEPRGRLGGWLFLLVATASPLAAQQSGTRVPVQPSAETIRFRTIAESLLTIAQQTRSAEEAARRERLLATRLDTISGFGATLRVPREDAGMVRVAMDSASRELAALHGTSRDAALRGFTATLVPSTLWEAPAILSRLTVKGWTSADTSWPIAQARAELPAWTVEGIRQHLYERVNIAAQSRIDRPMRDWVGDVMRTWPGDSTMWSDAYAAMAVSSSRPTRRCASGQGACEIIMGLSAPTDPWRDWFDPSDVRNRVLAPRFSEPDPSMRNRCEQGADSACDQYARQFTGAPQLPAPRVARRMLLVLALRQGGELAHQRMMADTTATLGARLAATAGVPLPVLLAAFADSLRHYRQPSPSVDGATAWSVTLTAALCLFMTLRRRRESAS